MNYCGMWYVGSTVSFLDLKPHPADEEQFQYMDRFQKVALLTPQLELRMSSVLPPLEHLQQQRRK